jgi:succinate dehydrogenase / fumarate reductase cytochrome b subunit
MQRAVTLYSTTIGKKAVMAVSGAILFGFVVAHLAGNLNVYAGPEAFNGYAEMLHSMPKLLWTARIALIFAVSAHIVSAFMLWRKNANARPVAYAKKKNLAEGYAARTMYWSGPILLFFIVYHLAHLTFGQTFGQYEWAEGNPYDNLVHGFKLWQIAVPYYLGNIALGFHLFHGVFSMFQSLGASHPKYDQYRRDLAVGMATLLTLGNLSIPTMVLLGKIPASDETIQLDLSGDSGGMIPAIPGLDSLH